MLMILFFSMKPGLHVKSCLCSNRYMQISMLMGSRLWTPLVVCYLVDLLEALPSCGRVMAIEYNNGNRKLLAVNIYMPRDDRSTNSANYDKFIKYLGMMHTIIHDCDISSVYMLVLTAILSLVKSCLLFV